MSSKGNYATYGSLTNPIEKEQVENMENDGVFNIQNIKQKQELIKNSQLCVIDMYAEWCVPCKHVAPKYKELVENYNKPGLCVLVKEDIELELPQIGNAEVYAVPTFLFYVKGQLQKDLTVAGANIQQVETNIVNTLNKLGI